MWLQIKGLKRSLKLIKASVCLTISDPIFGKLAERTKKYLSEVNYIVTLSQEPIGVKKTSLLSEKCLLKEVESIYKVELH